MTSHVTISVRSPRGVEVLVALVPLMPDGTLGRPVASHQCHANNVEESCQFAIYEGVALVVAEMLPPKAAEPPTPELPPAEALRAEADGSVTQVAVEPAPEGPDVPDGPASEGFEPGFEQRAGDAPEAAAAPVDAPAPDAPPAAPEAAAAPAAESKSRKRKT